MQDYYKILEVDREASPEVISKAYRTLAQKCHPDRFHSSDKSFSEEKMRTLNEAYEVLSNPKRRKSYDKTYRPGARKQSGPIIDPNRMLVIAATIVLATLFFKIVGIPVFTTLLGRLLVLAVIGLILYKLVKSQKRLG